MTPPSNTFRAWFRIILKSCLLFIVLDLALITFQPVDILKKVTLYGTLVPYRVRIMYAEPGNSINDQLVPLETMLAAHEIARPKSPDEYRVVVLGASGINGYGEPDDQTITGVMNRSGMSLNGKQIKTYNLAYPYTYLFKDLVIAQATLVYKPDLFILFVSVDNFNDERDPTENVAAPIRSFQINAPRVRQLTQQLHAEPYLAANYSTPVQR